MRRRILDAAVRVLRDEGALGFTTTKVAAEASVSVGSLYQYFPNKRAIVVALHDEDIARGWETATAILDRPTWSPRRKLTELMRWFFESEALEAETFGAVAGDLHVFLHDHTAARRDDELAAAIGRRAATFIAESSVVARSPSDLRFAADHLFATAEALAKSTAGRNLSRGQRRRWADTTAAMLADHLGFVPDEPEARPPRQGGSVT